MKTANELANLIDTLTATTDSCIGIYAYHLPSGYCYQKNAHERFFMASIFKIPIAIHCFKLIEQNKLHLTDPIEIRPTDIRPYGILDRHFHYPGVTLSLYNVMQLMLQLSDNTATDVILRLLGDAAAIMQSFSDPIFADLDITHSCLQILLQQAGVVPLPVDERCTLEQIQTLINAVPKAEQETAARNFSANPPNTATPKVIAELLTQIRQQTILTKESTHLLIHWMRGCKTGINRIRALLPANVQVADKTGTITGTIGDAAIIELPHNKGPLILVIFIKNSTKPKELDEKLMAQIARAVFDHVSLIQ